MESQLLKQKLKNLKTNNNIRWNFFYVNEHYFDLDFLKTSFKEESLDL